MTTTTPDAALLWARNVLVERWRGQNDGLADAYHSGVMDNVCEELSDLVFASRAGHSHDAGLLAALEGLVNALAANDEDGMTEFADVMVNARAAIAAAKGGRDAG